ncbi:Transaldolase [Clonorchis sinensis]|uniref:Transaldolase n=1 Tax=Clonorchis sinensis TaxID=79923 RepID=A0A3R7D3B5_CLOSI|nr:Transaldolase [Clonorchis sinensis]
MSSTLNRLKEVTTVVADTGDFEAIKKYSPVDSTTNPSLILLASKLPTYAHLIDEAVKFGLHQKTLEEQIRAAFDRVFVLFGCEILKVVPGRVSTEVDARHSFDVQKQVDTARHLISMYETMGVSKDRVLIKLSSTWEGIQAGKILESKYGIHCNLTLMFSLCQAIACAEAGVTLISPFVGRVLDWHVAKHGKVSYGRMDDPGVQLVTSIYKYYKSHGYKTEVSGDRCYLIFLIIHVVLLEACPMCVDSTVAFCGFSSIIFSFSAVLASTGTGSTLSRPAPITEAEFRWQLNQDEMASDKLSDGVRRFAKDAETLRELLKAKILGN